MRNGMILEVERDAAIGESCLRLPEPVPVDPEGNMRDGNGPRRHTAGPGSSAANSATPVRVPGATSIAGTPPHAAS
jgi:hypothetical protein